MKRERVRGFGEREIERQSDRQEEVAEKAGSRVGAGKAAKQERGIMATIANEAQFDFSVTGHSDAQRVQCSAEGM